MSNGLSDNDLRMATMLSAEGRYDYSVDRIAAGGAVWSLKSDDGWVAMTSQDGEECLPVWPHRDLAAQWATGDWADCTPEAISLAVWMERWTPGLEQDGTLVAVFPNMEEEGVIVPPSEFSDSLEKAIARR